MPRKRRELSTVVTREGRHRWMAQVVNESGTVVAERQFAREATANNQAPVVLEDYRRSQRQLTLPGSWSRCSMPN